MTGGSGFIGSHTCLILLENGFDVIVLDSFLNSSPRSIDRVKALIGNSDINKRLTIIEGDIRDYNLIDKVFENREQIGNSIDAVIHFAGVKAISESINNPLKYWDINVNGTCTLLSAMNKHNCKTIVFSSSATVYGSPQTLPISESEKVNPENPYGHSKAAIEQMLSDLYQTSCSDWKIAILRYFNPIGSHASGLLGEHPIGKPANLFPLISQVAAGRLKSLKVFGADWDSPDGTAIRDYIHVMDLADGHIAALNYLLTHEFSYLKLNLGTGKGYSVLEVISEFEKISGKRVPFEVVSKRKGDVAISVADSSLAKSKLNWCPTRSLTDCCVDGWKWQLLNPIGYS